MSGDHRPPNDGRAAGDDVARGNAGKVPDASGASPPYASSTDSFSVNTAREGGTTRLDPVGRDDSPARVRTDVPPDLPQLLPGEAALVYQHLRDKLSALFEKGDKKEERS